MHARPARLILTALLAISPQAGAADALNRTCLDGDAFSCLEGTPTLAGATRACDLGQPRGCLLAADLLLAEKKAKRALGFFEKACGFGDALGCYGAATVQTDGQGKLVNYPKAFVAVYRSCRQGYGPACTLAGRLHAEGLGTPADPVRAAMALRNGCERKDPRGCLLLGRILSKPQDAAAAFHQGCQLKAEAACAELEALRTRGVLAQSTLVPLLDPVLEREKALRNLPSGRNPVPYAEADCSKVTLSAACTSGDLAVCGLWADLNENGGDGPAAFCMQRQACERGDGHACEKLASAYEGGSLGNAPKVALGWYEKGCKGGSASACTNAARLIDAVDAKATENQRGTRKLELSVRGCALENAGDCALVYSALLGRVPDVALAQRAWITLGRYCEKAPRDGPVCAPVADRRAAIVLERECETGNAAACRDAAGLFADPLRATALLSKACTLGDCESCAGSKTAEGARLAGQTASLRQAARVCPVECKAALGEGPEPRACDLGVRVLTKLGGADNERKALALAEEQCRRGYSCDLLSELFVVSETITETDERRLGAVLARACEAGRPAACQAPIELAQIKPARLQCRQDKVEGCLKLGEQLTLSNVQLPQINDAWERGCKLGSNLACVRHWAALAVGPARDSKVVEESHRKASAACDGGDLQICIEIANHLKFRAADPEVLAELKFVAERVVNELGSRCDAGNGEACENAATFLQFKKDLNGAARARDFLHKACEHGQAARCVEIAEQRAREKAYVLAAQFGAKGCLAGSPTGCKLFVKHRSELAGQMLTEGDRALGIACAKKVRDACTLASQEGVPTVIETTVAPVPLSRAGTSVD